MKYIKTRDGIYIQCKLKGYENYYCLPNNTNITKEEDLFILKQADNIKELCDAFVDTSELKTTNTGGWLYDEFDSKNKCLVYYVEDEKRTIPLNEYDDLSKIRGAIWTDKGLIYVAKMNDKGELELCLL